MNKEKKFYNFYKK